MTGVDSSSAQSVVATQFGSPPPVTFAEFRIGFVAAAVGVTLIVNTAVLPGATFDRPAGIVHVTVCAAITQPAEALLMELARAYRLAGKTEDARKTLTQVVEQHADSPFASEAKAEIAKLKS